ncbi:type I-C CRISPR-associated protein Cas8c/Csd1 [Mitsuokella jalaludinii]|uniref:type I-C CRISPR-associated protein Cas8c/Csd1 n=1 Tax=Mitsuokella jalaludinii TaxID=187979 RepID=UPI00243254FD|nr:type I-C CRISPR-associated protein Cas8c/Csd1 [Mitsuokella jalaludinii]
MILQALAKRYQTMAEHGDAPQRGWCHVGVSFALELAENGELLRVYDLREEQSQGKKTVIRPRRMIVPDHPPRSGRQPPAYFLCDTATYFLGIAEEEDDPAKAEKKRQDALQRFTSAKELHEKLLQGMDVPAARAVLSFFRQWQPEKAKLNQAMKELFPEMAAGGNLVFRFQGHFVQEDAAIAERWERTMTAQQDDAQGICLVTGKKGPIARLHPKIKGVPGAQVSGANLVSFNMESSNSFCHEQGANAPVSEAASFAYGMALNALLADSDHRQIIGDTAVVYWAEMENEASQDLLSMSMFGGMSDKKQLTEEALNGLFQNLVKGQPICFEATEIPYSNPFYILGIAPNAARLSVRFFLRGAFGDFLQHVKAHRQRAAIVMPPRKPWNAPPLWAWLQATVSPNASNKRPLPILAGSTATAILKDAMYPASLYEQVLLRIHAEVDDTEAKPPHYKITGERASIIKAYLMKNKKRGELRMKLNEEITDPAYILGRIFSLREGIQKAANPSLNATVKDRYFDVASTTPSRVFPILERLTNHHLKKLAGESPKLKTYYEKQMTHLMGMLDASKGIPKVLNAEEQGMFILGYYQQTQARYEKKELKEAETAKIAVEKED